MSDNVTEESNLPQEKKENIASFSLFELMQHLRRIVAFNMRETLWIRAEISSASYNKASYYLELVQRDENQVKARCQAVIWASIMSKLKTKFNNIDFAQIFATGQQVLLNVEASLHEYHGLKLDVKDLDLVYTVGEMEQKRLATWAQIQAEGLHVLNAQIPMPKIAQRIAVISSKNAAGYKDFEAQLRKNPYGYIFETELFENAMQGENVAKNLVMNLKQIHAFQYQFDAVVIVRGGGSKLDLVSFDEYEICKAIANFPLPIVTGIGHEIDESLADKVAHTSLKTPTAVAEFFINKLLQVQQEIQVLQKRLDFAKQNFLAQKQQALAAIKVLAQKANQAAIQHKITQLHSLQQRYNYAHPRNTLNRGFVLVFDENKNRITSAEDLTEKQVLTLHFQDGSRQVVVLDKKSI